MVSNIKDVTQEKEIEISPSEIETSPSSKKQKKGNIGITDITLQNQGADSSLIQRITKFENEILYLNTQIKTMKEEMANLYGVVNDLTGSVNKINTLIQNLPPQMVPPLSLQLQKNFPEIGMDLTNKAFDSLKKGNLIEAENYAHNALDYDPQNPHPCNVLAEVNLKQNNLEIAESYVNRAIQLGDNSGSSDLILALIKLQQNPPDREEAEACLLRAIHLKPNSSEAYINLSQIQLWKGQVKDAEESALIAQKNGDRSVFSYALLAKIQFLSAQLIEAEKNASTALKILGDTLPLSQEGILAYFTLAEINLKHGALDLAKHYACAVNQVDPNFFQAHDLLAEVYFRQGKQMEANHHSILACQLDFNSSLRARAVELRMFLFNGPDSLHPCEFIDIANHFKPGEKYTFPFAFLADLRRRQNKWQEAEELAKLAINNDPKNPYGYTELIKIYLHNNDLDNALKITRDLLKVKEYNPEFAVLAELHLRLREVKEKQINKKEISKYIDVYLNAYTQFAYDNIRQGKFDKAESVANMAMQSYPEKPEGYLIIAEIRLRQGQHKDVESFIRHILDLEKTSDAYALLAKSKLRQGKKAEAFTHALNSIKIKNNNAFGHIVMAEYLLRERETKAALERLQISSNLSHSEILNAYQLAIQAEIDLLLGNIKDAKLKACQAIQLDASSAYGYAVLAHAFL